MIRQIFYGVISILYLSPLWHDLSKRVRTCRHPKKNLLKLSQLYMDVGTKKYILMRRLFMIFKLNFLAQCIKKNTHSDLTQGYVWISTIWLKKSFLKLRMKKTDYKNCKDTRPDCARLPSEKFCFYIFLYSVIQIFLTLIFFT